MITEQTYRIVCLQGAGFSSWDEPHTLDEILDKFWGYAQQDGMFDDEEDHKYHIEHDEAGNALMPDWFDLNFIQEVWEVEVVPYEQD